MRPLNSFSSLAAAAVLAALAGCQSLQSSENFLGVITPYRVEIVQGNVVTKEQAEAVKPGMSRAQVRDILGSPLLADPFHADRWDYVYWREATNGSREQRKLTVFFDNGTLARLDGDVVSSGGGTK